MVGQQLLQTNEKMLQYATVSDVTFRIHFLPPFRGSKHTQLQGDAVGWTLQAPQVLAQRRAMLPVLPNSNSKFKFKALQQGFRRPL